MANDHRTGLEHRKLRRIQIDLEDFTKYLLYLSSAYDSKPRFIHIPHYSNLPKDAEFISANINNTSRCVDLTFRSEEFEPVPSYQEIPYLNPWIFSIKGQKSGWVDRSDISTEWIHDYMEKKVEEWMQDGTEEIVRVLTNWAENNPMLDGGAMIDKFDNGEENY